MNAKPFLKRINIGCGCSPTPGYDNYDNSLSVRIATYRLVATVLGPGLPEHRRAFIKVARANNILWADARKRIPLADGTVRVLYSCHTFEHLDPREAKRFLTEARRVLASGGVIRLVVPDFAQQVAEYCKQKDADHFLTYSNLTQLNPRTFLEKLRFCMVGARHHLWAYDASSISRLLSTMGFQKVTVVSPGETTIENPGELDLYERAQWSLFVEAANP